MFFGLEILRPKLLVGKLHGRQGVCTSRSRREMANSELSRCRPGVDGVQEQNIPSGRELSPSGTS